MKTLPKLLVFLIVLFLFSIYHLSFIIAADAIPQPGKIPCDPDLKPDPEYNSLRPYQASPCGDIPLSLFCGNTLILFLDNVKTDYCGSEWCPYNGLNPITKNVVVDLKDVELPILGNTELVKNSQNSADKLDDATKVNEYVSWYLNGVVNRAEYGEGKNTDTEIVNFSGPVNKLLPEIIQEAQRIETIKSAAEQETTTDDDGTQTQQAQNHNQIAVCAQEGILGILGKTKPHECYEGNGSKAKADIYRLKDWNGDLSWFNGIANRLGADVWNKRVPPLPWDDGTGKSFENDVLYRKAYNEWQGKTCAIVPIIGALVCIDNPLVANKWADLYPYIPLANTVDKKGKEFKMSVHVTAPKAQILDSSYNDIPGFPPNFPLYFAHTKEDFQLAELLKKTYIPQEHASGGADPNTLKDFETIDPGQCQVVNVRNNPGDDVTFDNPKSNMGASIEYRVGLIKCELTRKYGCIDRDPVTNDCLAYGWIEDWKCESDVYAEIPLQLQYPYIDKVWESTTIGADSIFRRIFPKTGKDAPVSCIAEIPGETKANYSLDEAHSSQGVQLLKVKDPGGNASDNPKLYFPHLGTVYEYFLKGIQTALRPQGYGEPLTNGKLCENQAACGKLPNLPKASGSCALGGISSRVGNIPQSLKDIIEAASQTYNTPPNLILGIMYGEGLFNPGRLDWTDENVKNWATCTPVPGCSTSGDDNFMGFNGDDWANIVPNIEEDIKKLDPNRQPPSQCNLLDAIYGLAWNLHDSADGGMPFQCFGINLNAPVPGSCSWDNNQYESAIKVAESGYTQSCLTKEGGCATGGGLDAACPNGDTCETISNRYSDPSHNACVWDVAHGN